MGQEEQGIGGAANMPPFGRESLDRDEDDGYDGEYDEADYDEEGPPLRSGRHSAAGPRERIEKGMREIAERIQIAAEHLDDLASDRLDGAEGPLGRAGTVAHDVAARMESVAEYLYTNDVHGVRRSVERQVRAKPLQSVLVALAAGWLAGKILR